MAFKDDPDMRKECMNQAWCCDCPFDKDCEDWYDDSEEKAECLGDEMTYEFKEELL